MTKENLIKATTFLADRKFAMENRKIPNEVFGNRAPAVTVVIAGIFDERWLVEVEAVAAA